MHIIKKYWLASVNSISLYFEKLSNNYIALLEKGEDFNVIIKVGKSRDTKEFKVHSAILKYRSAYFRDKYIYGGFISLESFDTQFIFDLILVADEFLLEESVDSLETYLIESKTHWLRIHFIHVYKKCFQNNKLKELQNWCNNILKTNTVTVINVKGKDNVERIFGGYNPFEWDNKGWVRCHDSFVFSLKNSTDQNSILSSVKNPDIAILNYSDYGVYFGHALGMFVNHNGQDKGCYTWCCPDRYEEQIEQIDVGPPTIAQYYFVNEYEVFKIHKKSE
ncbi:hypothetical protein C2G38_2142868 [Gigaspora rosea]|uniref:TLDc domain-containing protein n=1 Tax=Gigaspora rosea TaxID=44941 RepID=A0A397V4N4_9GLOM|nr:hypothetical protein C2G38_2142868 [Gigaspora rosea]